MIRLTAAAASILLATPALAHTGLDLQHSFAGGFAHPFLGLDHLLAMVAVGLWAGLVGGRTVFAWPLSFVAMMAAGAGLGLAGVSLPGVETLIALSVAALGLAVAMQVPLPLLAGAAVCGLFALAHGFAHGAELPEGASALGYGAGFMLATAALHGAGVGLGFALSRLDRLWLPGLTGGAVAATGVVLLVG